MQVAEVAAQAPLMPDVDKGWKIVQWTRRAIRAGIEWNPVSRAREEWSGLAHLRLKKLELELAKTLWAQADQHTRIVWSDVDVLAMQMGGGYNDAPPRADGRPGGVDNVYHLLQRFERMRLIARPWRFDGNRWRKVIVVLNPAHAEWVPYRTRRDPRGKRRDVRVAELRPVDASEVQAPEQAEALPVDERRDGAELGGEAPVLEGATAAAVESSAASQGGLVRGPKPLCDQSDLGERSLCLSPELAASEPEPEPERTNPPPAPPLGESATEPPRAPSSGPRLSAAPPAREQESDGRGREHGSGRLFVDASGRRSTRSERGARGASALALSLVAFVAAKLGVTIHDEITAAKSVDRKLGKLAQSSRLAGIAEPGRRIERAADDIRAAAEGLPLDPWYARQRHLWTLDAVLVNLDRFAHAARTANPRAPAGSAPPASVGSARARGKMPEIGQGSATSSTPNPIAIPSDAMARLEALFGPGWQK